MPTKSGENSALEVGSAAPDFDLPRDGGGQVSLASLKGRSFVLYFYPKDDTPGCTKEAIGFTEQAEAFAKLGVEIFGVSKDPVAKHEKFIAKHALGVALLSDAESDMCERYGVWVEKAMYGKKYLGIERATFLIDGEGVIRAIWRKVKVPGHVEAVLKEAEALG